VLLTLTLGLLAQRPGRHGPYRIEAGEIAVEGGGGLRAGATISVSGSAPAHLRLPDGSRIVLDPGTSVAFREPPGMRQEAQLIAGQAHFDVAHGERPFLVKTDVGTITVLGTAFSVAYQPTVAPVMNVDVARGRVRVDHGASSHLLGDGERQRFESAGVPVKMRRARLVATDAAARTITVSTVDRRELNIIPLADTVTVRRDNRDARFDELIGGEPVELGLDASGIVVRVTGQGPQLSGVLRAVDPGARTLSLMVNGDRNHLERVALAPDVAVRRGPGRKGAAADLQPGQHLRLRLSFDLTRAVEIEIRGDAGP
jgi:hypothetical protein